MVVGDGREGVGTTRRVRTGETVVGSDVTLVVLGSIGGLGYSSRRDLWVLGDRSVRGGM